MKSHLQVRSKSLKDFYYLGAKCWNITPLDLRDIEDVKLFSKAYKARLLNAIKEDQDYRVNNNFNE